MGLAQLREMPQQTVDLLRPRPRFEPAIDVAALVTTDGETDEFLIVRRTDGREDELAGADQTVLSAGEAVTVITPTGGGSYSNHAGEGRRTFLGWLANLAFHRSAFGPAWEPNDEYEDDEHEEEQQAAWTGILDLHAEETLSIDVTLDDLTEMIRRLQAKRVVIDSLSGYELALAPLGVKPLMEFGGGCGFGQKKPDFWIGVVVGVVAWLISAASIFVGIAPIRLASRSAHGTARRDQDQSGGQRTAEAEGPGDGRRDVRDHTEGDERQRREEAERRVGEARVRADLAHQRSHAGERRPQVESDQEDPGQEQPATVPQGRHPHADGGGFQRRISGDVRT